MSEGGPAPAQPQDEESRNQRLTRNLAEMLAELRVAQAGVQILFGFLLAVAFTTTFRQASGFEKALHLIAVVFTSSATALILAAPAWHRMLFRGGRREDILRVGNLTALAGLACLACAVTVTVALIVKVVLGTIAMWAVAAPIGIFFFILWFVVPHRLSRKEHIGAQRSN